MSITFKALSAAECHSLLAAHHIGRLAYAYKQRVDIEPLHYVFPYAIRSKDPKVRGLVTEIQDKIKAEGLWAIFLDEELGGPGYGQLKLGLLNEVIGRYPSAPQMFGAAAPDTGNMEMLAAYGTEVQKERWLKPMLAQASPDQAVTRFLDFLAKIFLILGSLIIAYGAYLIHQGRVAEGLLGLLGGFILALAIPLMRFFLSIAGITV